MRSCTSKTGKQFLRGAVGSEEEAPLQCGSGAHFAEHSVGPFRGRLAGPGEENLGKFVHRGQESMTGEDHIRYGAENRTRGLSKSTEAAEIA